MFHVDNNSVPEIDLSDIFAEVTGTIQIQYTLFDSTADLISIIPEYSVDGGVNWDTASVTGTLANITDSLYTGTLLWASQDQINGLDIF